MNLFDELKQILAQLDEAVIPYLLVGGLAYSLHVEARATEDIDFMIFPDDWLRCVELLGELGYQDIAGAMDFKTIRIRRLVKIEDTDTLVLDFLLADPPYEKAFEKAYIVDFAGSKISVAAPQTLIDLKKGRMSSQDKVDIENLEKLLRGEL